MPHDVAAAELHARHALMSCNRSKASDQAALAMFRQVDLRRIARSHNSRARAHPRENIFICATVVFCASSRMMKSVVKVRPRM